MSQRMAVLVNDTVQSTDWKIANLLWLLLLLLLYLLLFVVAYWQTNFTISVLAFPLNILVIFVITAQIRASTMGPGKKVGNVSTYKPLSFHLFGISTRVYLRRRADQRTDMTSSYWDIPSVTVAAVSAVSAAAAAACQCFVFHQTPWNYVRENFETENKNCVTEIFSSGFDRPHEFCLMFKTRPDSRLNCRVLLGRSSNAN